jgi:L-fuculose-phosphate aldolase
VTGSPSPGSTPWSTARSDVVATCRRAAAERLVVGTAGNVSVGVGDHVAITATGADFATLEEQHVVLVDRSGRLVEGDLEPTSELDLHLGIHAAHEGPVAVVHTHAPVGVAVSTVLTSLPVVHYQQLLLGGEVRVAPFATFGTPELAAHVHSALEGRHAALMANHGSVAVGATPDKALEHALLLEWLCTVYRDARLMGSPRVLDEAEQAAVVEAALARSYGSTRAAVRPSTQGEA